MNNIFSCHCISFRKSSNSLTKEHDTALAKFELKIIQFSTLRNIQKLERTNISDLSYLLKLDRTTVLRNIEKLIEMDLVSFKCKNNNKIKAVSLNTVGKSKLKEATIICEKTQYKYTKALGIKNYEEFETLIT